MAMLPFCGYNMGDYFGHWLAMGKAVSKPPKIFHVNWFRQDAAGKFLWPGFGENLRVLLWMVDRIKGSGTGDETPIGVVPRRNSLNLDGLDLSSAALDQLLSVDRDEWAGEIPEIEAFFAKFGSRLPGQLTKELEALAGRVSKVAV